MTGGDRRLALCIYRSLLRWSRDNADAPFSLRPGDVYAVAPRHRSADRATHAAALSLQDAVAVPPIARAEFKACAQLAGLDAQEALDRGLEAVRVLHTVYQGQLQAMRDMRRDRGDRTGVRFQVGQVFIHKKVGSGLTTSVPLVPVCRRCCAGLPLLVPDSSGCWCVAPLALQFGYRATIFGWDRECERDDEWQRDMNIQVLHPRAPPVLRMHRACVGRRARCGVLNVNPAVPHCLQNPKQPFYYALPDETDCVRLFGGGEQASAQALHQAVGSCAVQKSEHAHFLPLRLQCGSPSTCRRTIFSPATHASCTEASG
jgi:hypothetical protein